MESSALIAASRPILLASASACRTRCCASCSDVCQGISYPRPAPAPVPVAQLLVLVLLVLLVLALAGRGARDAGELAGCGQLLPPAPLALPAALLAPPMSSSSWWCLSPISVASLPARGRGGE